MRTIKLVAVLVLSLAAACGGGAFGPSTWDEVAADYGYGPLEIPAGAAEEAGWNAAEAEATWESCDAEERSLARRALVLYRDGYSWVSTRGGERVRSGPCAVALLQLLGAAEIDRVTAGIGPGAGLPGEVYGYRIEWRPPPGCTINAAGRQCGDAGGGR